MLKIYADEYNTLEFSKVDAKDFTIDGTERSCKGYQTVVTKDNVNFTVSFSSAVIMIVSTLPSLLP